jgi:uncharacterized protein with PIN domain
MLLDSYAHIAMLPLRLNMISIEKVGVMAICPRCEADLSEWSQRLERAPAASSPKVWTCPECDVILGISDYE